MSVDLTTMKVDFSPQWLNDFQAKHGSDEGEILAISPEFLDMARNPHNGQIRRIPTDGKQLLELMTSKSRHRSL